MKSHKNIVFIPGLLLLFLATTGSALALTISPVKVEVTGNPGQTLQGELTLLNEQKENKTFFSTFENFEPSGETGSPKFVGAKDGLATWINTQESVDVATDETIKVPYSITIPNNAEPGGYFAAIFWGEQNPDTQAGGEVSIGGKIGVIILLRVAGDIEEVAGISDFTTADGKKFKTNLPVIFNYRFKNSGGDRVVPLGDITIKNIFGFVAATLPANSKEGSVLPDSARKFEVLWGESTNEDEVRSFFTTAKGQLKNFHVGPYKANLSLVYGATNQSATDDFWFFLFPWQLLLLATLGLLILGIVLKLYNAWIISKSKSKSDV